MKNEKKSLKLKRETLKALTAEQLAMANGASGYGYGNSNVQYYC